MNNRNVWMGVQKDQFAYLQQKTSYRRTQELGFEKRIETGFQHSNNIFIKPLSRDCRWSFSLLIILIRYAQHLLRTQMFLISKL